MRLRDAAALALVGWYLLLPPDLPSNPQFDWRSKAPLNHWSIYHSYDTATACEAGEQSESNYILAEEQSFAKSSDAALAKAAHQDLVEMKAAVCIASDDPRLRERRK
jgi:hypothetical protein